MAKYRGELKGNRGGVTRLGTERSGITGHVYSWTFGIRATIHPDPEDRNKDLAVIEITRGGGMGGTVKVLKTLRVNTDGSFEGVER